MTILIDDSQGRQTDQSQRVLDSQIEPWLRATSHMIGDIRWDGRILRTTIGWGGVYFSTVRSQGLAFPEGGGHVTELAASSRDAAARLHSFVPC
jgi:hypothetical protein